ncbi:Abi family protein [Plebeiibacterium marinum]|uniref:Abi family protein n=1 Tax=Plebeiibacterium marinum TaxID=2992111 RepID=A0AAE3MAL9_9BACT|nr:Abi family protein [Plebeiobacterium marinum]MCW3804336.1 Abi family protein [Plebeiobacterium marinum]
MNYDKLELFVSTSRIRKYLFACNNSKTRALELYKANILLSEAFYPILNNFEVLFRNAVNRELIKHFDDPKWIINEKDGFMSHPSLRKTDFYIKKSVISAEKRLNRKRRPLTPSAIMAEQEFGFWTSFFEAKPFGLLKASILNVFPFRPESTDRSAIRDILKEIREFRNRVYHNEPICFDDGHINLSDAINVRRNIYSLLRWIDYDLFKYVWYYDRLEKRINAVKRI